MAIPRFPLNNAVTFNAAIQDDNGNLVDPSTVYFMTAGSDGVTYTNQAIRASLGQYYYTFTTATPTGRWAGRFQGVGALNVQSEDYQYIVETPSF